MTPLQNKLIDTIIGSRMHITATMRTKTEYVIEQVNGKSVPRKVGMAPIQRADVEYEFDIYADMDIDNTMIIQKSRCSALFGQVISKPDASTAFVIQTWLEGEPSAPIQTEAPTPETSPQDKADKGLDQAVRDKLNDLYGRAWKLKICTNERQFVDYIRRILDNSRLDVKYVTLEHLAKVEDDMVIQEMAKDLEQGRLQPAAS